MFDLSGLVRKITGKKEDRRFDLSIDDTGLHFSLEQTELEKCQKGQGSGWLLHQYVLLQMLAEQDIAESTGQGFFIPTEEAVNLDRETARLLELPAPFDGYFLTDVEGQTGAGNFRVRIIPTDRNRFKLPHYSVVGPCLQFGEQERYLLSAPEWLALHALSAHQELPDEERTEHRNLGLIGVLQRAQDQGMTIDLAHFNELKVIHPEKVSLAAEQMADGSLVLTPVFGTEDSPDFIQARMGQIKGVRDVAALRAGKRVICLDEEKLRATHEVLSNRRIPESQVQTFLECPSAFLNSALIDLDTGFSLRVMGAEKFESRSFGSNSTTGSIGWFHNELENANLNKLRALLGKYSEKDLEAILERGVRDGAASLEIEDWTVDLSNPELLREQLAQVIQEQLGKEAETGAGDGDAEPIPESTVRSSLALVESEDVGALLRRQVGEPEYSGVLDYQMFKRTPLPHQEEGIHWMLGLIEKAQQSTALDLYRVSGAGLFDDMGLGKTMQSLSVMHAVLTNPDFNQLTDKPLLVVAPLSLLENWKEEIEKTFEKSPFFDVVVLQTDGDLSRFKVEGAKSEIQQSFDGEHLLTENAIRYSLKVGREYGVERLDMPRRLVLATYQTLRDYQFSMCRVDWSLCLFDEAQNLKTPHILQTRAAKALKAVFKLAITGTPVENTLGDFWSLFDVVQPGLLGTWKHFSETYVPKISETKENALAAFEERLECGERLRQDVGRFMLRRMKDDTLKGLPSKHMFTGIRTVDAPGVTFRPELCGVMSRGQLESYDSVLWQYNNSGPSTVLPLLQQLREVSLHPALLDESTIPNPTNAKEARKIGEESVKIAGVFRILDEIRKRQEKAIIFVTNKKLQRHLKVWLGEIYGISVPIINGETKAGVSKKKLSGDRIDIIGTRSEIVDRFQQQPGFGILIMSPVAAGVGLTIVEANNVIHLERLWNPAREAQATDRVYRIGQTRDVNIYFPAAIHPEVTSFDTHLDTLLSCKIGIKDAVMAPRIVTAESFSGLKNG